MVWGGGGGCGPQAQECLALNLTEKFGAPTAQGPTAEAPTLGVGLA